MSADNTPSPAVTRVQVTGTELAEAVATTNGPFSALVTVAADDEQGLVALAMACAAHVDRLARDCVGVVVVSSDANVLEAIVEHSGTLPFPITALADEQAASGWLAGQEAVGVHGSRPSGTSRSIGLSGRLADYIEANTSPAADEVTVTLAARTRDVFDADAAMNVGHMQGLLLQFLAEHGRVRRVLEIGTFTGMSTRYLAQALPADGVVVALEIDPAPLDIAREAWRAAGVDDKITTIVGPALESIATLPPDPFDLAFIDADKRGYGAYLDAILPLMAPDGIVCVDNTLWSGAVVDERAIDADTTALRQFNADVAARDDLQVIVLPVGDGLSIIRRR